MSGILTIRGLVFDMDGLLLDTERVALGCWKEAERETGIVLPEGFYFSIIGQSITRIEARLRERDGGDELIGVYLRKANQKYRAALDAGEIHLKAGARALLRHLRDQRIPVCLATSTHRALADHKLAFTGIGDCFTGSVCGDEVADAKPAPDIYLKASRRLGFSPRELLALEDSENGLQAALEAGCRTAHVPDIAPVALGVQARADRVYRSLEAVQESILREEIRFF